MGDKVKDLREHDVDMASLCGRMSRKETNDRDKFNYFTVLFG